MSVPSVPAAGTAGAADASKSARPHCDIVTEWAKDKDVKHVHGSEISGGIVECGILQGSSRYKVVPHMKGQVLVVVRSCAQVVKLDDLKAKLDAEYDRHSSLVKEWKGVEQALQSMKTGIGPGILTKTKEGWKSLDLEKITRMKFEDILEAPGVQVIGSVRHPDRDSYVVVEHSEKDYKRTPASMWYMQQVAKNCERLGAKQAPANEPFRFYELYHKGLNREWMTDRWSVGRALSASAREPLVALLTADEQKKVTAFLDDDSLPNVDWFNRVKDAKETKPVGWAKHVPLVFMRFVRADGAFPTFEIVYT